MAGPSGLSRRHRRPEIMDQPALEERRHFAALCGLERINRLSGSAGILWPPLAALAAETPGRPLRVLDGATGAGDIPLRLWGKARRAGLALDIDGCDRSPTAVAFARRRAGGQAAAVRFFTADALAGD